LLFTLSPDAAKRLLRKKPRHFYPIGEITPGKQGLRLVDRNGKEKSVVLKGYRHF
jgi:hypothetical protein